MTSPLSRWGDPTGPPGHGDGDDPRVLRTRQRVLEVAHTLLVQQGPAGLTHSALAAAAGVSRQTLYRYWPTPIDLVADMVRSRVGRTLPRAADAESGFRQYLQALRATLEDPSTQAAYAMLISAAVCDPSAEEVLKKVVADRRRLLNEALDGLRSPVTAEEYALVVGPLTYLALIAREPITDAVLDRIARLSSAIPLSRGTG